MSPRRPREIFPREESTAAKPRRGFRPSRGSFKWKQAPAPLQSTHGLCARRRVTCAPARDDEDAAVAILVYKVVKGAAASKADSKTCQFGDKAAGRRYAPTATSLWGAPQSSAAPAHRPGWTVAFSAKTTCSLPWTVSMDAPDAVRCAPIRRHCGIPSRRSLSGKRTKPSI